MHIHVDVQFISITFTAALKIMNEKYREMNVQHTQSKVKGYKGDEWEQTVKYI